VQVLVQREIWGSSTVCFENLIGVQTFGVRMFGRKNSFSRVQEEAHTCAVAWVFVSANNKCGFVDRNCLSRLVFEFGSSQVCVPKTSRSQ